MTTTGSRGSQVSRWAARHRMAFALVAPWLVCIGCAPRPSVQQQSLAAEQEPRPWQLVDPRTGTNLTWSQLIELAAQADVVILGEQHDNAVGHAVQRAVVEDMPDDRPLVLSMEMLERHEQSVVDNYLAGLETTDSFMSKTQSADWAGPGTWVTWYQPIIDALRARSTNEQRMPDVPKRPLVAANAPRELVRLARTDGFDAVLQAANAKQASASDASTTVGAAAEAESLSLAAVPKADRRAFDGYFDRFVAVMSGHQTAGPTSAPASEAADAAKVAADAARDAANAARRARLESVFRAQLVWDATMADSIVRAAEPTAPRERRPRVVHLVGQFHSDYSGGLVVELRHRAPGLRLLVVSLDPRPDVPTHDPQRSDVLVLTSSPSRQQNP